MSIKRRTFLQYAGATVGISTLTSLMASTVTGAAKQPHVVFVTGDHEYSGELTLPFIAAELEKNYGMRTTVLKAYPDYNGEKDMPAGYRLYNRGISGTE